jgi:hypothetical protein
MEFSKQEISVVKETVEQGQEQAFQCLSDLELALVGGGLGEVVIG